jgi:plastocyanin
MRSRVARLLITAAPIIVGCSKDTISPMADARVSVQDQCDPATFNASLGAGTCTKQGSITLSQFNSELSATHRVAAWQFVPSAFTIRVGQSITATNDGGEKHTFTEVKAFGGGIVPSLNTASGNTQEAPECASLSPTAMIASGATFRTDAATDVGTELYQCCIHPWMRATVTVTQ